VPLFQRQIEAGGPVTITHPDITRYFMTIPEAVSLVLQAGAEGVSDTRERGGIYVLEMGRPIKIIDLARQMINLTGRRPDVDIKIDIVGLRPGEKLYEEVAHTDETVSPTSVKSVLKLMPRTSDLRIVRQQVQEFRQACNNGDVNRVVRLLKISVPEYRPDQDAQSA
jgi:O-antigen biosynthesis protein WbqV